MNYINATNYIMNIDPNQELFIDFDTAKIKNPRYFKKEKYLLVNINDEDVFFQAETAETRGFIKFHLGINIDEFLSRCWVLCFSVDGNNKTLFRPCQNCSQCEHCKHRPTDKEIERELKKINEGKK